jgi:amino acid transporter
MKKIIIYTLLATIFSSCITEKKITEKKQIKEWDINYTENNLDSELPVSKSKNEILNDSYYQSKKILPVVEQLLASNEELKNDIIINQHLELEKHKNIKNIIIRNDSIKKKNSLSDNNLKNKVSDIAKLSKISIRSFLLFFTSMSIYGIANLADVDVEPLGLIDFTLAFIGVLGLLGAAVGLLLSFLVFIKIKYNKINVAEQDKKIKRNFRISNFISWFIIGITTFLIALISYWGFI